MRGFEGNCAARSSVAIALRALRGPAEASSSGPVVLRWPVTPSSASREAPPIVCFAHTVPLAPPFLLDPFPGFREEILLMKLNESRKRCAHEVESDDRPRSHESRTTVPVLERKSHKRGGKLLRFALLVV